MAANKINALVDGWNTKANLKLTGEQEQKLKALLNGAVEKVQARREAGKKVVEELQAAVEANDNAKTEELLQKLREGLRQVGQGREQFLDHFDQVLQPEQRARVLIAIVHKAKESGKPIEHLIDNLLSNGGDDE